MNFFLKCIILVFTVLLVLSCSKQSDQIVKNNKPEILMLNDSILMLKSEESLPDQGQALEFYNNFNIKRMFFYNEYKVTGQCIYFSEGGSLERLEIYDSTGTLVDYYYFDSKGKVVLDKLALIFIEKPEKVSLGANVFFKMRSANKVYQNEKIIIGNRIDEKYLIRDTIEVITPSKNGEYIYQYTGNKLGLDTLYFSLITDSRNSKNDYNYMVQDKPYIIILDVVEGS